MNHCPKYRRYRGQLNLSLCPQVSYINKGYPSAMGNCSEIVNKDGIEISEYFTEEGTILQGHERSVGVSG